MFGRTRSFCFAFILLVAPAWAADFDSGSDGSDGAFNPQQSVTIDLSQAVTSPPGNGHGVYDANHWAVIFNYTTINIPSGVTIRFANHPSGAPVIWLASGDVTISGGVSLDGESGTSVGGYTPPTVTVSGGPGGFPGGFAGANLSPTPYRPGGGYGPGGGGTHPSQDWSSGGSYATLGTNPSGSTSFGPIYGNTFVLPLIGGSGGGGGWGDSGFGRNGGGGGGAILIASSTKIEFNGASLHANGGNHLGGYAASGAGGSIRLVSNQVLGQASISAKGGFDFPSGGDGRIRVEGNYIGLAPPSTPAFSSGTPGLLFPPINAPELRATVLASLPVPSDPAADPLSPDLTINTDQPQTLSIEAENIPVGTTVDVRVIPKHAGMPFVVTSSPLSGTLALSTATAQITFPSGLSEVQMRAALPDQGARGPNNPFDMDWRFAYGRRGRAATAATINSANTSSRETASARAARKGQAGTPRYQRVHAVIAVETGPRPNEMTYVTGDGRRVTYPADFFNDATALLSKAKAQSDVIAIARRR